MQHNREALELTRTVELGRMPGPGRVEQYPPLPLPITEALATRLPRMTTRRWMVAVAIVGLIMGGIVGHDRLERRRGLFLALARTHFLSEVAYHNEANLYYPLEESLRGGTTDADVYQRNYRKRRKENAIQLTRYHRAMVNKYRRAVQYPWLPVEPDPPEPE